jgi:hypothetical protein
VSILLSLRLLHRPCQIVDDLDFLDYLNRLCSLNCFPLSRSCIQLENYLVKLYDILRVCGKPAYFKRVKPLSLLLTRLLFFFRVAAMCFGEIKLYILILLWGYKKFGLGRSFVIDS